VWQICLRGLSLLIKTLSSRGKNTGGEVKIDNDLANRIAEVVEASSTSFMAQCYELYKSPALGSLVKTGDIYGIVGNAVTSGIDPGRHALARGKDEPTEEAIFQNNPQLLQLLRTEFKVVVVGYHKDGNLYHYLPPEPARIHAFVYQCQPEEVRAFSRSFGFLNTLLHVSLDTPGEELVAAALRQMSQAQEDAHNFLVTAGKELSVLLSGDFIKLKSILGRLK
jgi:hypothetical protein